MARPSSKNAILNAAEAIVIKSGAAHMTLDAVAKEAGVSKGGLMYNFPTKEALLQAMIDRMVEHFEEIREEIKEEFPGESDNDLIIEMRIMQRESESKRRLSAALLAVVANNPDLTKKTREVMHQRFNTRVATGHNAVRSSILFFAAMGIQLHSLLNLSMLDDGQKEGIQRELLRLASCDEDI